MTNPEVLKSRPEWQTIDDIKLKRVFEYDPDFSNAIEIYATEEEAESEAKKELIRNNWWLRPEWQEKGNPQEQIDITAGDYKLSIFNFGQPLEQIRLNELENIIKNFQKFGLQEILEKVKYILINNQGKINPNNGEEQLGEGVCGKDPSITIFNKALENTGHRVKGASNFEGTIMHELSHQINPEIFRKWIQKFWHQLDEARPLSDTPNSGSWFDPNDSEKCITDYAKLLPNEDLCDSMVAAIKNPDALNPEKLKFIRNNILRETESKMQEISIIRKTGQDTQIPKLGTDINYKNSGSFDIQIL